jgi:hypothetical protein
MNSAPKMQFPISALNITTVPTMFNFSCTHPSKLRTPENNVMFPDMFYCRPKEQPEQPLSFTFPFYCCSLEITVLVLAFGVQVCNQMVVVALPTVRGLLVRAELKKSIQIQH